MSHFPSTHLVTAFDSAKSQPLTGQRLAKARYKTTAKVKAKYPNVCVSVPFIEDAAILEATPRLVACIREMLESAQDGVFKSLYEAGQGVLTGVTDSDLSIDACIGFLEAESQGTRLTKEFIDSWFIRELHDTCFVLFAEKLGYSGDLSAEQEATISRHITGYKDMYSALAGGKTMYQPHQVKNLRKVLALVELDDTGVKLDKRLEKMLEVKPIAEMLEL